MIYTVEEIEARQKKKNKISKRIRMIVYIILIPILIYNIIIILQSTLNPNEKNNLIIRAYVIVSGSMEPELSIGDLVVVKQENNLKEGDIISFWYGESIVTHRIIKIEKENGKNIYTTKGDSNNVEDNGTITDENIIGKKIITIPKLGKITLIFQGKLAIIIMLIIFLIYIKCIKMKDKKREERKVTRKHYEQEQEKEK